MSHLGCLIAINSKQFQQFRWKRYLLRDMGQVTDSIGRLESLSQRSRSLPKPYCRTSPAKLPLLLGTDIPACTSVSTDVGSLHCYKPLLEITYGGHYLIGMGACSVCGSLLQQLQIQSLGQWCLMSRTLTTCLCVNCQRG